MMRIASVCAIALAFGCPFLSAAEEVDHRSARADKDSRGVHAEPQFFRREFANSAVVVLRIRIPPHATIPQHDVSPRVVVWLTDAHLELTFPDGTVREESYRAGQTLWVTPERHAGLNLSDRPIEFIAVIPTARGIRP